VPLLDVRNLSTHFFTRQGRLPAVDGVSFQIAPGETVALVGESGCGKSVTAASILRLVPDPPGRIVAGEILFEGRDLLKITAGDMRAVRGNRIGMVFQEPMTSLNPVFTIGDQIAEVVREHQKLSRAAAYARVADLLNLVRIPDPHRLIRDYPHRLSGGMRQRVMIAMAIACEPALLIADEPTTALDVTTQAQILELLDELKQRLGMAMLLITHDLGVVAQTAQRVLIMYAGRVVEAAAVKDLFEEPLHPYTRGLLQSLPRPDAEVDAAGRPPPLVEIAGTVPSPAALPIGCRFAPRCPHALDACRQGDVPLKIFVRERAAACLRAGDLRSAAP
jgi:oligopeptide/dipeptide ABC transporter ATP-binding protein